MLSDLIKELILKMVCLISLSISSPYSDLVNLQVDARHGISLFSMHSIMSNMMVKLFHALRDFKKKKKFSRVICYFMYLL